MKLRLSGFALALLFCLPSMSLANEVSTLAGNGTKGTTADGSVATKASIGEPYGLVIGPDGALYICEIANHLVRRLDLQSGTLTRVAGNGTKGYSGDGGSALDAQCDEPYEVRFDSKGNMVFVEMKNAVVRKVDKETGKISTIAGTGKVGFSGDGGPATQATFKQPHSIAFDEHDNLYICDIGNHRVRRVDGKTGIVTTLVGGGNTAPGPGTSSIENLALKGPRALDYAGNGVLILALREGNAIYRLDLNKKTLTHLAGTGKKGYTGDGGPGQQALLSGPKGVAIDSKGNIYFADTESHTIRVIRPETGIVETVCGNGKRGDGLDKDPLKCEMNRPHGVCVDKEGNVYIGDSEAHKVRVVKFSK